MGGHVFRKYIREQFLIVGLQVFHFLLLLGRLQLPQKIQSVLVHTVHVNILRLYEKYLNKLYHVFPRCFMKYIDISLAYSKTCHAYIPRVLLTYNCNWHIFTNPRVAIRNIFSVNIFALIRFQNVNIFMKYPVYKFTLASLSLYAALVSTVKLFCGNQFVRSSIRDIIRHEMKVLVGNSTRASKVYNAQVRDVSTS